MYFFSVPNFSKDLFLVKEQNYKACILVKKLGISKTVGDLVLNWEAVIFNTHLSEKDLIKNIDFSFHLSFNP